MLHRFGLERRGARVEVDGVVAHRVGGLRRIWPLRVTGLMIRRRNPRGSTPWAMTNCSLLRRSKTRVI